MRVGGGIDSRAMHREAYVQSIAGRDLGRIDRIAAGKKELRKLGEVLAPEEGIETLLSGQRGRGLIKENGAIAITERRVLFASRSECQEWPFSAISYAEYRATWSNPELKLFLVDGGEATLTNVTPADRVEQAARMITERTAGTLPPGDSRGHVGGNQIRTPWGSALADLEQSPEEDGLVARYALEAQQLTDLKDADRALEAVHKEHRTRVEGARRALREAKESYSAAISVRERAAQAEESRVLASVGLLKRVTLYETLITTPGGTYELTPDVTARAELHGMKQAVQGWIYKTDHDRREAYLHINGPGWSEVVSYQMKSSSVTPGDLYQFAETINQAARHNEATRTALGQQADQRTREFIAALLDSAAVERAASRLVDVAQSDGRVKAYAAHLEGLLSKADRGDRQVREAAERLPRVRAELVELVSTAAGEAERAADEATRGRQEAERLQAEIAPSQSPVAEDIEVASPSDTQGDVFEQLRKLAELRDAGVVTDEEFSQKKGDLLGRL